MYIFTPNSFRLFNRAISRRLLQVFSAATVSIVSLSTASYAIPITVDGTDFDVSTIEGSFEDNQQLLESQAWWGDFDLAESFATVLADALGLPNNVGEGSESPWFTYQTLGSEFVSIFFFSPEKMELVSAGSNNLSDVGTYAIATEIAPVPIPTAGLLMLACVASFAGVAGLKLRRKNSI